MKKNILLVLSLIFVTSVFAAGNKKILSPGLNEVVIVGKVNVHINEDDLVFFAKSCGVEDFSKPDSYVLYDDSYTETYYMFVGNISKSTNDDYHVFGADEYFLSKRKIKKNEVTATSPVLWCFYSDDEFQIYLPLLFKTTVPKGEKYIYIVDFDFYLDGSDFHPLKIVVSDNFDLAKESLERTYGTSVNLCRVEIQNLD